MNTMSASAATSVAEDTRTRGHEDARVEDVAARDLGVLDLGVRQLTVVVVIAAELDRDATTRAGLGGRQAGQQHLVADVVGVGDLLGVESTPLPLTSRPVSTAVPPSLQCAPVGSAARRVTVPRDSSGASCRSAQNAWNRTPRDQTCRPNGRPGEIHGSGRADPRRGGASPIVDNAASATTAQIYGVPIIGDVHEHEHRACVGLRRGAVTVAHDAAEADELDGNRVRRQREGERFGQGTELGCAVLDAMIRSARVTRTRAEVPAVVVVHVKKMKEAWCLATTLSERKAADVVKLYGRRFTIEETSICSVAP